MKRIREFGPTSPRFSIVPPGSTSDAWGQNKKPPMRIAPFSMCHCDRWAQELPPYFFETFLLFSLHFQNKSLSLQTNRSRTFKWINMALKIKTREEAIAVLRDMVKRKREMEAKAQIDFAKARKEAANCYAGL